jgi:uncharacterized protein (TIGR02466 family)
MLPKKQNKYYTMNTDYYFPTPIWWTDTTVDLESLYSFYQGLRERDSGRDMSNFGGWQSHDILEHDYHITDDFIKIVEEYSAKCINDYGFLNTTSLKMTNLWISANSNGGFNQIHNHAGAFISGTFYIKVPKNAGEIVFYKNHYEEYATTGVAPIVQHTAISASTCRYEPREGRLILFPGYLQHAVMPTQGDDERISLSFNMRIENV